MDWAFIFQVVAYTFLFLAVEALAVHLYIKKHGGNWGRFILKVLFVGYTTMLAGGFIVGSITYVLLLPLK